jgi:hypothetical protein
MLHALLLYFLYGSQFKQRLLLYIRIGNCFKAVRSVHCGFMYSFIMVHIFGLSNEYVNRMVLYNLCEVFTVLYTLVP